MADSVVNRSSPTMLRSRALPSIPTQPPTPTAYRLNQYTDATEEKRVAELCLSTLKNLKIRPRELVSSRPSRYNLAQLSRIRSIVSIFLHAGAKISQRS